MLSSGLRSRRGQPSGLRYSHPILTRLKVDGFKNLVGVDVHFGPFTCVAGPNGVGKSNLFDAIRFLSALTEKPLMEAALSVRGEEERTSDLGSSIASGIDRAPKCASSSR